MLAKLLIIGALLVIVYNLGAGLYYMVSDQGRSERTVRALTWRIGLSIALFLLILLAMATGLIEPHSVSPRPGPP